MRTETIGGRRGSKSGNLNHARITGRSSNGDVMTRKKGYHYTESGLNNIWLLNGFTIHKTPYGSGVSIENIGGLHKAIAHMLVSNKPRWSGGEFRFIRKELDMSQKSLSDIFGKDVQTIARWEKSGRVPKMADRFLRAIYRDHVNGNEGIIDFVRRLNDLDQKRYERVTFDKMDGEWAVSDKAA